MPRSEDFDLLLGGPEKARASQREIMRTVRRAQMNRELP
jgi:hypothetical protein